MTVPTPREGDADAASAGYDALRHTVGIMERTDRILMRIVGEQAVRMVNGLVSNTVEPLDSGRAVFTFILTPKGRTLAMARLFPDAGGLLLEVPTACSEDVLSHLGKYLPPIYARFEPLPDLRVLSLVGPRSEHALLNGLAALGWTAADSPESLPSLGISRLDPHDSGETRTGTTHTDETGLLLVRREAAEGPGFDLLLPSSRVELALNCLSEAARDQEGQSVSDRAYQVWRVERGLPEHGRDITPDNLPQETGLEQRTISYDKGCYTGQEVVARIHYRGHVNRRLQGLRFGGGLMPPESGTGLFFEERTAGAVTSAVVSPVHGPIGLGYIRREVETGSLLTTQPGAEPTIQTSDLPFTAM